MQVHGRDVRHAGGNGFAEVQARGIADAPASAVGGLSESEQSLRSAPSRRRACHPYPRW